MFQPQVVRIGWYKDNSVYIRTAMPFSTRSSLEPLQYDIHLSTIEVHFPPPVMQMRPRRRGRVSSLRLLARRLLEQRLQQEILPGVMVSRLDAIRV
jgi:hypothetical protein